METIKIEFNVYQIEEHPDKNKCFNWIRNNWHGLNLHGVNEVCDSLKALKNIIGGTLNYSIGQFATRNEHITFRDYATEKLSELDSNTCPLTGYFWDMHLIEGRIEGEPDRVLKSLHEETQYIYSNEGLEELCINNGYMFKENGEFYK